MNYTRHMDMRLSEHIRSLKEAIVLLGARQVGKTTLLKKLFPSACYLSVDNETIRSVLERYDISAYRALVSTGIDTLVIDEIHVLTDPGRAAKILYDHMPGVHMIFTGSSALTIKNRTTESLAGRHMDYHVYPLSMSEYLVQKGIVPDLFFPIVRHILMSASFPVERIYPFDVVAVTHAAMQYGLYPAILAHPQKEAYLQNLVESVVFRDLLELSLIDNREAARNLLRLLAYQIGNLVNINELATKLKIDVKTVRRYITLFEQSFIVFTLPPYTRRGRKEIGKMPKIYFYDCGLRNALLHDFQPMEGRADSGALFENFVISEVMKANYYGHFGYTLHFWRTTDGSEVDLVLEKGTTLVGLEIKSSSRRTNTAFRRRYPSATFSILTPHNYL